MENYKSCKLSDLEKMLPNWSHGTIYNRIKFLGIQGNSEFMHKERTTGKVIYSPKAVEKIIDLYKKEFPETSEMKFFNFDKVDRVDKDSVNVTESREIKDSMEEKKENIEESFDNMEVKTSQNESIKSIPLELHNKIVVGLEQQVEILKNEVERLSNQNNLLITQHESLIQNNETLTRVIGVKEQNTLEEKREKRQFIGTAEDNEQNLKWWQKIFGKK